MKTNQIVCPKCGTKFQINGVDVKMSANNKNSKAAKRIEQMAANIVKWADANPQVDIISLWPYDYKSEQCCCELCKIYSKNANYSYFVSRIIEKVNKTKPDIKIDRISYLDLTECDTDGLSSTVIIDETTWHEKLRTVGDVVAYIEENR